MFISIPVYFLLGGDLTGLSNHKFEKQKYIMAKNEESTVVEATKMRC